MAIDEEEDRKLEEEKEQQKRLELEKANTPSSAEKDSQASDAWLDALPESTKNPSKRPELFNTKLKRVEVKKLIWARIPGYLRTRTCFPGRICENSEGACVKLDAGKWPIPADHVLVEFFCGIKKLDQSTSSEYPRLYVMEKKEVKAFNAVGERFKQLDITSCFKRDENEDDSNPNKWDIGHFEKLEYELKAGKFKCTSKDIARECVKKIKDKSIEFLKNAIDYHIPAPPAAIDNSETQEEEDDYDEEAYAALGPRDDAGDKLDIVQLYGRNQVG